MINKILELLKTKFLGVDETALSRVAKKLAETTKTEEEAKTKVESVTFQQVLDSYTESRVTEAQKTAVANYEKKHGIKDGKPISVDPPKSNPTDIPDETPAWAKSLAEGFANLTKKVDAMQGAELEKTRKQKLAEVIGSLPDYLRKSYERLDLSNYKDDEFATLITEITDEVGTIAKEHKLKGVVFGKPIVNGSPVSQTETQEATKEEVDAVMGHLGI